MIGRLTCVTPTGTKLLVLNTVCGEAETWVAENIFQGFYQLLLSFWWFHLVWTKIQDLRAPIEKYLPGEAVSDARRWMEKADKQRNLSE